MKTYRDVLLTVAAIAATIENAGLEAGAKEEAAEAVLRDFLPEAEAITASIVKVYYCLDESDDKFVAVVFYIVEDGEGQVLPALGYKVPSWAKSPELVEYDEFADALWKRVRNKK